MIGYISDNLLIPILDFFYGLVPSYGLAIVALTIVIRVALYPLSAGSIRSARRMRIAQPVMQKRQADIKARYANNIQKQQEELGKVMKEFGSPLAGCLPLLVQMPILFALFATLRGSPFADVPYTLNLKVLPADQIAAVEPKPFNSASHSIFIGETDHVPVIASLPRGTKLGVGDSATVNLHTKDGRPFSEILEGLEDSGRFARTGRSPKVMGLLALAKTEPSRLSVPVMPPWRRKFQALRLAAASSSSKPLVRWASTPMVLSIGTLPSSLADLV